MIIREREHSFILISQHDHAKISGVIAQNWKDSYFNGVEKKAEVVLGIYEHDRGWIEPDAAPLWNSNKQKPHSFTDFPLDLKVAYYKKGIDEVEKMSKYASLLCSLHYVSFLQYEEDPIGAKFVEDEITRQLHLLKACGILGKMSKEKQLQYHLNILKFCDNLSLYICLNEPGAKKEREHPFYKNGISPSFSFSKNMPIQVKWSDQETVSLSVSPLEKEIQVQLLYKEVKKEDIIANGLLSVYSKTPFSHKNVALAAGIN
ncbi:DUF3891 family protein [Neobacillus bataviensis]|uniref:DUF3891 family protein n=1 Tax=Neobacillus bataviensis TaxID=220685 RepID=UPI001CBE61AB|nr:DUF3891 family protein [Neobacillus bataviensis]